MDTTRTEDLLREALAICQRVTDCVEIDQALLRAVFMRLDEEAQEAAYEADDDGPAVGCTVH
ncbi:hypothetical protein ACTPOE_16830 [Castellaniella sp. WN]